MKNLFYFVFVAVIMLFTACSKSDESPEPASSSLGFTDSVIYQITVIDSNLYNIVYLAKDGTHEIKNHRGNFEIKVPVKVKNGSAIVMLKVTSIRSDDGSSPTINVGLCAKTKTGFIIAKTYPDPGGCGFNEKTIQEKTPLGWFNVK